MVGRDGGRTAQEAIPCFVELWPGVPTKGFSKKMLEVRSCTSWVTAGRAGAVWLFRCGYCGFIDLLPCTV